MNCTIDLSDRLPQSKKEQKRSAMAAKVKAAFEAEGYVLRSEYVNNRTKLEVTCLGGHNRVTTWGSFQQGHRCAECAGKIVTHEQVKAVLESEGYTLKSDYANKHTKLEFTCPGGHNRAATWDSLRQGKRCAECAGKAVAPDLVKAAFKADGYTLRSEYVNSSTKLEFTCPNGHNRAICWNDFRRGRRCAECAGQVVTHEQVRAAFESEEYTLKNNYVSAHAELQFTCSNGHDRTTSWNVFQQGIRCGECARRGYNSLLPGTLYYVRFELKTGWAYKIGITNFTVKKRFSREKAPYTVIWQQRYEDGAVPPEIEKEILRTHKKYQYKGSALESGNTECFTHDVLKLDRDKVQLRLFAA